MKEVSLPTLKYKDEDGDLCTLVEASVDDMLELSNSGTLRLFATKDPAAAVEACAEEDIDEEVVAVAAEAPNLLGDSLPEVDTQEANQAE